jgi:hypothetical protein
MGMVNIVASCALFLQLTKAFITPDYHSLVWKFEKNNFWAPLGLNTSTYALESPAGAAPEALNKRDVGGYKGQQYQPCTVVTLVGQLSAAALTEALDAYVALGDDVWSEAQVRNVQLNFATSNAVSSWNASSFSRAEMRQASIDLPSPHSSRTNRFPISLLLPPTT